MDIEQRIDVYGRIEIPEEFRNVLRAAGGDKFRVRQWEDGTTGLKLIEKFKACVLCNSSYQIVETSHGYICKKCLSDIMAAAIRSAKSIIEIEVFQPIVNGEVIYDPHDIPEWEDIRE